MIKYTHEHEWLDITDGIATIGITVHAAEQLGDLIFIELPEVGREVRKGEEIVVLESVKAASDISAPLDGEIVEVNDAIVDDPGSVNTEAESAWFFKLRLADESAAEELLDNDAYQALIN